MAYPIPYKKTISFCGTSSPHFPLGLRPLSPLEDFCSPHPLCVDNQKFLELNYVLHLQTAKHIWEILLQEVL